MKSELVLDAKGLACPMPIVKQKAIAGIESGQILEVHVTDKGAKTIFRLGRHQVVMNLSNMKKKQAS